VRPTDDGRFGPVIDAEAVEIAGEVEVRGREGG
jgi:hypothetical protein